MIGHAASITHQMRAAQLQTRLTLRPGPYITWGSSIPSGPVMAVTCCHGCLLELANTELFLAFPMHFLANYI